MPGIHVRAIGRLVWEDRNNEPALTVPGSYWLCHKNNIYKFTFKFHKTIRSVVEFSYSKELMKIIRRVIKRQPKQGQHFSTKNLLVTYNHASWTRQDKTFAVMKFCDRPDANAFPHAFILTVKVFKREHQSQLQTGERIGVSAAKGESEKPTLVPINPDGSSNRLSPKQSLDETEEFIDVISTQNYQEKENKNDVSWSLRTRSRVKDSDKHVHDSSTASRPSVLPEKTESLVNEIFDENKNSSITEGDMHCNGQDKSLEETPMTSPLRLGVANPNSQDEDSNDSQFSASLPYQYLIERDIERELEISRLANTNTGVKETSLAVTNLLPTTSHATSPPTSPFVAELSDSRNGETDMKTIKESRKVGRPRSRQQSRDNDSTNTLPDVANLRSSDITDLVMKGLMFTIRQDKDTVTVVEQKTKLELDEVLENSEKVETKEGDPCLRNSSLLRLESMITRIEEPILPVEQRSNGLSDNAVASFMDLANEINMDTDERLKEVEQADKRVKSQNNNTPTLEGNSWSQLFSSKEISDSTFEKLEKVLGDPSMYISNEDPNAELKQKVHDEEEEEDIIPEALVNHAFFNEALERSKTPSSIEGFQDLLIDETDDVQIIYEGSKSAASNDLNSAPLLNGAKPTKDASKLPKIVSNEVITTDQIPPALLKVLKNKSIFQSVNKADTNNENQSIIQNNEIKNNTDSILEDDSEKVKVQRNPPLNDSVDKVVKLKENSVRSDNISLPSIQDDINNIKRCTVLSNSVNDVHITSKSSFNMENSNDKSSRKSTNIKNSDISNSSMVSNVRLTRSNSKLQTLSNELACTSNGISSKHELYTEKSIQKVLMKNSDEQLNNSISLRQKRRNSSNNQCTKKNFKSDSVNDSEQKDVKIKVWKLLSDLRYGVNVVVERLDITKIPR